MQAPQDHSVEHVPTACMIVIGNEILSGRTQDKNLAWIAKELSTLGVPLKEARVIPDHPQTIIDAVNAARAAFTYVFTSGGIGPTHDDITTDCVAAAFGVAVERNKDAVAMLERHYGDQLNEARLKMANIPASATLIENPVSAAPGYRIENVYVMAGVPSIFQAMFANIKHELKGGATILSRTIAAYITEGALAEKLAIIQAASPDVEIGSYPFMRNGRLGTSLVTRGTDPAMLDKVYSQIKTLLLSLTHEIMENDQAA
jgi:molybdenum cofactor synthesis domain-containing protein